MRPLRHPAEVLSSRGPAAEMGERGDPRDPPSGQISSPGSSRGGIAGLPLALVVLISALAMPAVGWAAGPWKAQIVDAQTKQPLEGVVVVAAWWRATRTLGGPSEEYHDSEEVVTDKAGRFSIRARRYSSLNPLVFFKGPERGEQNPCNPNLVNEMGARRAERARGRHC